MLNNSDATPRRPRDYQRLVRIGLGALVAVNLAAAALVMFPPGGSAEDLEGQFAILQTQVRSKQALLEQTRMNVNAIQNGRGDGDQFLNEYFLARRTAYATLLSELDEAARQSQIKPRELAYATEPIEGSDSLSMMTITANYEGSYADVMQFVRQVDRSPRLLIIESLNAAPQQGTNTLVVNMKLETFVREETQAE